MRRARSIKAAVGAAVLAIGGTLLTGCTDVMFRYGQANATNDAGIVVGSYWPVPDIVDHAFRWDPADRAPQDLGTLGGTYSSAADINEAGVIVGSSTLATGGSSHAFRWDPDTEEMVDLGTLGGTLSVASAINDAGVIVGRSTTSTGDLHAFRWDPATGVMVDLGTLGGTTSSANDINDSGVIVGTSTASGSTVEQAVRWSPGATSPEALPSLPGGTTARALAVNDSGAIVGSSEIVGEDPCELYGFSCPPTRPVRWSPAGAVTALPVLAGDTHGAAYDINDSGVIVGSSEVLPQLCSRCAPNNNGWALRLDGTLKEIGSPDFVPFDIDGNNRAVGVSYEFDGSFAYYRRAEQVFFTAPTD
jgi:probable HAF family extracellular repeat protein